MGRRGAIKPIADFMNPMLAKDLALGRCTRPRGLLLVPLAVCAALVGWGMLIVSFDDLYTIREPVTLFPFLAILFTPAFAAGTWIRELGGATLDQLSMTMMRPGEVARAKVIAAGAPVLAAALGMLGASAILWILARHGVGALESRNVHALTHYLLPTALPRLLGIVCLTVIALMGASFAGRATHAVVAAYGSVLLVLAAFPVENVTYALLGTQVQSRAGVANAYEGLLYLFPGGIVVAAHAGVMALAAFTNLVWLLLAYAIFRQRLRRQFTGKARA